MWKDDYRGEDKTVEGEVCDWGEHLNMNLHDAAPYLAVKKSSYSENIPLYNLKGCLNTWNSPDDSFLPDRGQLWCRFTERKGTPEGQNWNFCGNVPPCGKWLLP